MRFALSAFLFCLSLTHAFSQEPAPGRRPKIGLALSGGGAKGLAHIGILKAIDSAGLKIDLITGTSMGSVVGGLYAVGYSGDSIEQIARRTDWPQLLTNRTSLRAMTMEEKGDYGRFAVELPLVKGRFLLPSGVLEGQELWLLLNSLLVPAYQTNDFFQLSIPFMCVGTEVESGAAVAIGQGNLTSAIRASMAIPTVFTAVDVDGCKLVDGGLVRNFPVTDVKVMGADYVIGSSVSSGLLPQEKLTNAAQILMQIVFFQEALDEPKEVALCDIYVKHPIDDYSAASFNRANELIDLGIREGNKMYPQFKHLADSLDAIYGPQPFVKNRLPKVDSLLITSCEVLGLRQTSYDYFTRMMNYRDGRYYRVEQLNEMIRQVFGTRYYNRITYELKPLPDGSAKIVFHVEENPAAYAKLGMHYNTFSGASLIANLTARNFLLPNSRSQAAINISENFRAKGEHLQFVGRHRNRALIGSLYFESYNFTTYLDFRKDGLFRQSWFNSELKFQVSRRRRFSTGLGYRYESLQYRPSIQSQLDLRGRNRINSALIYWQYNTFDQPVFAQRGVRLDAELGYVFRQNPAVTFFNNGEPIGNLDSLGIRFNDYARVWLNLETCTPMRNRFTFFTQTQLGVNFNYRDNLLNNFYIGGLNRLHRNQVTFAGLPEGADHAANLLAFQTGLRRELFSNLFLTLRANVLAKDFIDSENMFRQPSFRSGYALTLGYNSALGPLEFSLQYSDQSKQFVTYINLGFSF